MPHVDHVEAAVGEGDAPTALAPLRQDRVELGGGQHLPPALRGDVQGGQDLRAADGGRAAPADHQTGRVVGEVHGHLEPQAGRQGQGQVGDHRVPGAGHVEDRAREGGHPPAVPGRVLVVHALRAEGDDHAAQLGLGEELARPSGDVLQVGEAPAQRLLRLPAVGRDQGRAAVAAEVPPLGVDQHRHPDLAPGADDRLQHPRGEQALAVVREDHRLGSADALGERAHHLGLDVRSDRTRDLPVDPQHLLHAAGHAGLLGRRTRAVDDAAVGGHAHGLQHLAQHPPPAVVPHHAHGIHLGLQGAQVADHVAGAAEAILGALRGQDRDRRLGRDAAHLAADVAVEDQVADDQDARATDALQRGLELFADHLVSPPPALSADRAPSLGPIWTCPPPGGSGIAAGAPR